MNRRQEIRLLFGVALSILGFAGGTAWAQAISGTVTDGGKRAVSGLSLIHI